MKILKWCSIVLLALILWKCRSEPAKKAVGKSPAEFLFYQSAAHFQFAEIGDSPESLKLSEKSLVALRTDTLIEVHWEIDSIPTPASVTVYYAYDNFGLFEIQADIFPEKEAYLSNYMQSIEKELDKRYGDHKSIGNIKRWTTNSSSNNVVEISLSNETADFGEPFVSLNFLEPLEDEL